jgi:hypothetical protein
MKHKNCFLTLFFGLLATVAWGQFAVPQYIKRDTLAQSDSPWYVLDWDGDGDRDILFSAYDGLTQEGGVYYLKNDGTGKFDHATPITEMTYGISLGLVGDINGDGSPDLVTQGPSGCNCVVWRPNLGNGTLGNAIPVGPYNPGFWTEIQKLVDWDGDGDLDVVMVDRWFENTGLGLFNDFHLFSGAATYFRDAIADLNGDNRQDVLQVNYGTGMDTLQWIRQLPDGSFTGKINIGILPPSAEQYTTTDLDADGDVDFLLFSSLPSGQVCWWYANDGMGVFGPGTVIPTSGDFMIAHLQKPNLGDLDGDGLTEIFFNAYDTVQHTRSFAWFQNLGAGQFDLKTANYSDIYFDFTLLVADVTGDDKNDVVENNGAFFVRKNAGSAALSELESLNAHDAASGTQLLDVDNDDDLDLYFLSNRTRNLGWRANDGSGHFGAPQVLERILDVHYLFVNTASDKPDLNGDGMTDLMVWTGARSYVYLGTGNGQFAPPDTFPMPQDRSRTLGLADADEDGDLDAVFVFSDAQQLLAPDSMTWYANDGTGKFGPVVTNAAPTYEEVSACNGDLNGDGEIDLLIHNFEGAGFPGLTGSFYWYPNLGGGVYGPKQLICHYQNAPTYLSSICARDMDNDGDLDVSSVFGWFENDGQGQGWQQKGYYLFFTVYSNLMAEDFDNDSDTDVFFVFNTGFSPALGNRVYLYKNDGEGRFTIEPDWSDLSIRPDYVDTKAVDFDNDQDLDVFFTSGNYTGWLENVSGLPPVSAKCFLDNDGNGQQDSTESPLPGAALRLDPGGLVAFANANGIGRFYVDTGTYQITYLPGDCRVLTTDSASYTVQTPLPGPIKAFGFQPDSAQVSISPFLAATTATRCGFEVPFQASMRNAGCIAQRASFALRLAPLTQFTNATPWPNLIQGDSLVWHSTDSLLPGEIRPIWLSLTMPGPDHLGETIRLKGYAWPGNALDKAQSTPFESVINCAYDPNDKAVNHSIIPPGYEPEDWELSYNIRFQNTGTDTAFNIIIRDQLDTLLDWSTFRPIVASHPMRPVLDLNNGEAQFIFDHILLPDSNVNEPLSHGFVQFAIRLKSGLPTGTVVRNQAGIYFDFNPPILTNTTDTKIEAPSSVSYDTNIWKAILFPNPSAGAFTIELSEPATADMRFRVLDLTGRLVAEQVAQIGSDTQFMDMHSVCDPTSSANSSPRAKPTACLPNCSAPMLASTRSSSRKSRCSPPATKPSPAPNAPEP